MPVNIVTSQVIPFRIPGPVPREAACLVLRADTGDEGAGEAAPIEGFSPEALATSIHALHAVRTTLDAIDESAPPVEAASRALAPHAAVLASAPSARFAVETALFDLLARRRGEDVASCLRAGGAEGGAPEPIETSALLRGPADPAFIERVTAALARGFRVLKVKLRAVDDETLDREIEGLRALRRVAPDVELRLDPNGRWSIEEARRRLARLAEVTPSFVEQPVSPEDLAHLGRCAVPWAADESLGLPGFPERLSAEAGCAAFVLKPAALGICRARELAKVARSRGLGVVVTHFFDGPIGLAAACETALSLGGKLLACGLDPHVGLSSLPKSALPHHGAPAAANARSLLPRNSGDEGHGDGDGHGDAPGDGPRTGAFPRIHRTGATGLGLPRDVPTLLAPWMS